MDEQYWKGQVDTKLDFISDELKAAKDTLISNTAKNDADHEIIKKEIGDLKIKSSVWGMVAGAAGAAGAMITKYFFMGK